MSKNPETGDHNNNPTPEKDALHFSGVIWVKDGEKSSTTSNTTDKPSTDAEDKKTPKRWRGLNLWEWAQVLITPITFLTLITYIIVGSKQISQTRDVINRTEATGKTEMRAYVSIDSIRLTSCSLREVSFEISAINTGKTPAYNQTTYATIKNGGMGVYPDEFKKTISDTTKIIPGVQGNGLRFTAKFTEQYPPGLTEEHILSIKRGLREIFFYGAIVYQDVFGDKHHTNFCVVPYFYADTVRYCRTYPRFNDAD